MPSDLEIAQKFSLWGEYVDPSGCFSKEEFDELSLKERLAIMRVCFGEQEPELRGTEDN